MIKLISSNPPDFFSVRGAILYHHVSVSVFKTVINKLNLRLNFADRTKITHHALINDLK